MYIDELAEVYGMLADTTRLRILNLLRAGPLCVCHIVVAMDLPQSTVSRHLSWLKVGGLIELNQMERFSIYTLLRKDWHAAIVSNAAGLAADSKDGQADLVRLRLALREMPNKFVVRTE